MRRHVPCANVARPLCGTRIGMLEHAIRYADADLTALDRQAIATLVKAGHVVRGEIDNPSYAQAGRERVR